MALSARSFLTSGIAALGVGAVALAPVQPTPSAGLTPEPVVRALAVNLAAAIDPITPWIDTVKASLENVGGLTALYLQQPLPLLTTIARNQLTYLRELPDVGLIASQMLANVKTFFTAPYDSIPDNISDSMITTIEGFPISQQTVYALLQTVIVNGESELAPVIDFTGPRVSADLQQLLVASATPVSGELIGLLGPVISPLIQLTESFTAIGQYWQKGEVSSALNELINIPANVTNATLNGGKNSDLTGVVASLGFTIPPEIKSIGLNMGGLLNVVPTAYEPPTIPTSDVHPYSGGLAFDAIATDVESFLAFKDPGWPVGAIGSVMGLGQALGDAMLVTPPAPAATRVVAAAAAEPEAVQSVAPIDAVEPSTPAAVDVPDEATTPTGLDAPEPKPGRTAARSATSDSGHSAGPRGMGRSAAAHGAN